MAAATSVAFASVNKERVDAGLKRALRLHEPLCALAARHAKEMAEHGHASHRGLDGRLPHQRYNSTKRGGARSHVKEFIFAEDGAGYATDAASLEKLIHVARAQLADGKGARNEDATAVAFGVAVTATAFRYVELVVTEVVDLDEVSCPDQLLTAELTLSGAVAPESGFSPWAVVVTYDGVPLPRSVAELRAQPSVVDYEDRGVEATTYFGPRDLSCSADGTFSIVDFRVEEFELRAGSYYIQLFVMNAKKKQAALHGGGGGSAALEGAVCGGVVLLDVDHVHLASAFETMEKFVDESEYYTLEEQAARHDAAAAATKADGVPLCEVCVFKSVGAFLAGDHDRLERSVYMPVERAEQLTTANVGLAFRRLASDADEDAQVIVDVAVVAGTAASMPDPPEGFEVVPSANLLPAAFPGSTRDLDEPQCLLCVCVAPASDAQGQAVVDVALVYGADRPEGEGGPNFDMGGGYETTKLPPVVTEAYGCPLFLCVKREGAGRKAAERVAQQKAVEAAHALKLADDVSVTYKEDKAFGADGGGGGDDDDDDDEGLLDTTLTPDQVRELEQRRADQLREAEARADAEQRDRETAAQFDALRDEMRRLADVKMDLLRTNADLQRRLGALLGASKRAETASKQAAATPDNTNNNNSNNNTNAASGGADGGAPHHRGPEAAAAAAAAPAGASAAAAAEGEKQYSEALSAIFDAKRRAAKQRAEFDRDAYELQTRLDEKEFKAKKIAESFREFKHEIALAAEHSRTSKPISRRVIEQFEQLEVRRESEVEKVRLKNINLRMSLRKLEASLRAKEQLAEGLHLIDFEQLKIENATLNEKIEERNEELSKLRKKNTANVQIVTHFKEKLQFIQAQNSTLATQLNAIDVDLAADRDAIARAKRDRDTLKTDNAALKQRQGFVNSDLLVVDFEKRKRDLVRVHQKIQDLQARHAHLGRDVERFDDLAQQANLTNPE